MPKLTQLNQHILELWRNSYYYLNPNDKRYYRCQKLLFGENIVGRQIFQCQDMATILRNGIRDE